MCFAYTVKNVVPLGARVVPSIDRLKQTAGIFVQQPLGLQELHLTIVKLQLNC